MNITTEKLTIWAKRAIPALALAATAGVMLPSCEKEPIEQHDEVILYYNNNNNNPRVSFDTIRKYSVDKSVRSIYITVTNGNDFLSASANTISGHRRTLQKKNGCFAKSSWSW
ncbi:MAG: hypothetical protein K2H70_05800 [Bacteroidales bacterium]|nr:hypothetical protein [Bacteroidales bacterium]